MLTLAALLVLSNAIETPRTLEQLDRALEQTAAIRSAEQRADATQHLLDELEAAGRLPFAEGGRVRFLFGGAESAAVAGDFNGWSASAALRVPDLPLHALELELPADARVDYKWIVDGERWMLDPRNARRQRSGFGDNSCVWMPGYEPSPWLAELPEEQRGVLLPAQTIESDALQLEIQYRVHVPVGGSDGCPLLVVTDGHEYADAEMGALPRVLDALVAAERIRPVVAVFVDPRVAGKNLRAEQYVRNPAFARFLAHELVPRIEAVHGTSPRRPDRAILGTSLGGVNALYCATEAAGTFGCIAAQSPALHVAEEPLREALGELEVGPTRFLLSTGTLRDGERRTRELQALLEETGHPSRLLVTNEGHSWGQWSALLDDVLVHFFAAP